MHKSPAPGRWRERQGAARIVAKVDQPMWLCDALEAGLAQTESQWRKLVAAVLASDCTQGGAMFDQQYPNLASWILDGDGWIELGQDDFSRSTVRILDIGGLIWESDERYETVDQALEAVERALAQWIEENL